MSSGRFKLSAAKYRLLLIAAEERDEGLCWICDSPNITPHHIARRSSGGGDFLENIACLCISEDDCHGKVDRYELELPESKLEAIGYYNSDQRRLEK